MNTNLLDVHPVLCQTLLIKCDKSEVMVFFTMHIYLFISSILARKKKYLK